MRTPVLTVSAVDLLEFEGRLSLAKFHSLSPQPSALSLSLSLDSPPNPLMGRARKRPLHDSLMIPKAC